MNKSITSALCACIFTIGMMPIASATIMTVEISGFINNKPSEFLSTTPVKVGDTFSISFNYDDSLESSALVNIGGDLYTKITQPFSPPILSWSGSMPDEIAANNILSSTGGIDGWGYEESLYRPITTLHHNEWFLSSGSFSGNDGQRGFDIHIVTNFAGDLGYGWWSIGSGIYDGIVPGRTIDYGFLDITGLSIAPYIPSPVPEPSTYAMLLAGLGLLGFMARRRKESAA